MKKPIEIIEADKTVRWRFLLAVLLYILWLLWLEPFIDFLLTHLAIDPLDVAALNASKQRVAALAYSLTRSLPVVLFLWLGFRIVTSASLPPARMRFPITVIRIKGKRAMMFGLLCMVISLLVLALEANLLVGRWTS